MCRHYCYATEYIQQNKNITVATFATVILNYDLSALLCKGLKACVEVSSKSNRCTSTTDIIHYVTEGLSVWWTSLLHGVLQSQSLFLHEFNGDDSSDRLAVHTIRQHRRRHRLPPAKGEREHRS